jgi:unsaturated rhamnogalacturonyl hydrolase
MDTIDRSAAISARMALSVMNRYSPDQMLWHYEHGLVIQAVDEAGKANGRPEWLDWAKKKYDSKILGDGSVDSYRKDEFNLDQINPGKELFALYRATGDKRYRVAIETLREQLRNQPRTESGGFWHKKIYPWQMWLDGLYMQGPFYARYAAEFGTDADFDDVVSQLALVESKTRDGATGLLYHAWDESRKQLWANRETGCSPHFWGRAMGWYCMALVDSLDYIPPTARHARSRETLIAIVARLADAIPKYQDPVSGMWYQVLDQGKRDKNYLETSASSMFAYFLFKAVRSGYVSGDAARLALSVARKGYEGIVREKLTEGPDGSLHLSGICSVAGLGGNPYRDGSYQYYVKEPVVSDDFKGVGPFILASIEAERL